MFLPILFLLYFREIATNFNSVHLSPGLRLFLREESLKATFFMELNNLFILLMQMKLIYRSYEILKLPDPHKKPFTTYILLILTFTAESNAETTKVSI